MPNDVEGSSGGSFGRSADLVAFVAVLVTGVLLITEVHMPVQGMCEFLLGLGGLYAAWRSR